MSENILIPEITVSRVLDQCLGLRKGEEVVLLIDEGTDSLVVDALRRGVESRDAVCLVLSMERFSRPGSEPPSPVACLLEAADAAIELTSTFIGSSQARQRATLSGTRYLMSISRHFDPRQRRSPARGRRHLLIDSEQLPARTSQARSKGARGDPYTALQFPGAHTWPHLILNLELHPWRGAATVLL